MSEPASPSSRTWFLRGAAMIASVPAVILMSAYVGFASLARDGGVSLVEAIFMTGAIWALPSQVVLVGAITSGASLFAAAVAVALSAVRLMPMTVSLLPLLRARGTPRWKLFAISHFIAVTAYVVAMLKLPAMPREARLSFFAGFAVSLTVANMVVTAVAYSLIGQVPPAVSALLLFLTPLYFMASMWGAARHRTERLGLVGGLLAAPLFHMVHPEFDLLLTGLVVGTLVYGGDRAWRRWTEGDT